MQSRWLGFLVFFGIALTLVGAMHYYVWFRLGRSPGWPAGWQRGAGIAVAVAAVATPVGILLGRLLPRSAARLVADATYSWVGLIFVLLTLLLAAELVRLCVLGGSTAIGRPLGAESRTLLARTLAVAVLTIGVGAAVLGRLVARGTPAVVRVPVVLERLPVEMSGLRIVQLSDLHVGDSIDGRWLARVVERVNALEPDLVAITGDLVDGSVAELGPEVAAVGSLRAKHGVYFVTGNHEYYSGADDWIAELRRLGIRVLRNERVAIEGANGAAVDLAGVDDYNAFGRDHGPDLARAVRGRDGGRALVLLAHQPREAERAERAGVGLQLSGHTHGGQIFPWNHAVRLQQPYVSGLVRQGALQIYVSRGTGYWGPPMRIGAPPEITVLELRAPSAPAEPAL